MAGHPTRRTALAAGASAAAAAALAGCGFGIGSSRTDSGVAVWDISTDAEQDLVINAAERFNARSAGAPVVPQFFQNDPYKNRLRTALMSGTPPDLFYGWGGDQLRAFVDAGEVAEVPARVDTGRYLPAVMEAVTFGGRVYGVPKAGTQPKVFFYNTEVFADLGLEPPRTWAELTGAVEALADSGVVPLSLAGQNLWTNMMYLEYLVNRVGGREPLQAVLARERGAWSHPAFLQAVAMIQELVAAEAFPRGFAALNADTNQDAQLLYSGRAGMLLHGSWTYLSLLNDAPDFVGGGGLGWFPFPEVDGGAGDTADVVGNLTNYYSLTTASRHPGRAGDFLDAAVLDEAMVDGLIALGLVPPVTGLEDRLAEAESPEWLRFVYGLARDAPYFDLSWDQALDPRSAQELLTGLGQVFAQRITPEGFAQAMNEAMEL
ncbi:extracellular solute-binding protein [Nocardiopsis coralliicola]